MSYRKNENLCVHQSVLPSVHPACLLSSLVLGNWNQAILVPAEFIICPALVPLLTRLYSWLWVWIECMDIARFPPSARDWVCGKASEWANERVNAVERAQERSSLKQASESVVRANERTDGQVAHYLLPVLKTTVKTCSQTCSQNLFSKPPSNGLIQSWMKSVHVVLSTHCFLKRILTMHHFPDIRSVSNQFRTWSLLFLLCHWPDLL